MTSQDKNEISGAVRQDVVIVDPVCAKRAGHNLPTLSKYAAFFADHGCRVVAVHIASTFAEVPAGVIADLTFNYAPFFDPEISSQRHLRDKRVARGFGPKVSREATKFFFGYPMLHYRAASAACSDLIRLLNKYPDATLFFPGADFYVIWAVRKLAMSGLLRKRNLSLRLMGVMETAGFMPMPERVLPQLIRDIVCAAAESVTLTAETEKYARRIESWAQVHVPVTLIPAFSSGKTSRTPKRRNAHLSCAANPLVLGFLGGARADKGYADLPEIAHQLYAQFGLAVRCHIQTMSPREAYYSRDDNNNLARWPNVHLLPTVISDEQLICAIQDCHALILPYSIGTYEWRGSAMLFDALSMGVPVIGRRGTAFGESIDSFGLGYTFEHPAELVTHVRSFIETIESDSATDSWRQAGANYLLTLEAALERSVIPNEEVVYIH